MYINITLVHIRMPFYFKCLLVKMHMNLKSVIVIWPGIRVLSYAYIQIYTSLNT